MQSVMFDGLAIRAANVADRDMRHLMRMQCLLREAIVMRRVAKEQYDAEIAELDEQIKAERKRLGLETTPFI